MAIPVMFTVSPVFTAAGGHRWGAAKRDHRRAPRLFEDASILGKSHPLFWGADAASICRRLDCVCVDILYFWAGAAVLFRDAGTCEDGNSAARVASTSLAWSGLAMATDNRAALVKKAWGGYRRGGVQRGRG